PSFELTRRAPSTLAAGGPPGPTSYTTRLVPGSDWRGLCGRAVTPRRLVAQHRPATHQELACQRHDGLLLAGLAATKPLGDRPRPAVVPQHDPGAPDQQFPQQRRATPRDAATPV